MSKRRHQLRNELRMVQRISRSGKQLLAGNTKRRADSTVVKDLRKENNQLKELVAELALTHAGAPYHPMTQVKIERYHRSMKSVVKLQNYYTPSELEQSITSPRQMFILVNQMG